MKNYLTFINEKLNISNLPKSQDWKIKIIKDTIDKVDQNLNSIPIRKSNNYFYNILLNSNLCEMYKKYYLFTGIKVKKLPIPNDKMVNDVFGSYEEMEEIYLKIDEQLISDNMLIKNVMNILKNYLIWITYFPYILEYRDKQYLDHFKTTLIDYLKKPFNIKEMLDNQSLINHHLVVADSFDEIRTKRLIEDIENSLQDLDRVEKAYSKIYLKNIEYKSYENQLDVFEDFLRKYDYCMKDIFQNDFVHFSNILDLKPSVYVGFNKEEREEKLKNLKIIFTGDFKTDYMNFVNCHKKYYNKI